MIKAGIKKIDLAQKYVKNRALLSQNMTLLASFSYTFRAFFVSY